MISLVDKVIAVCSALEHAAIPHALGGALALAYATEEPRGTRDIDVNVFVSSDLTARVLEALPNDVRWTQADVEAARRDGQVRVWWDETPLNVFFAEAPYHHEVDRRCRTVPFAVDLEVAAERLAMLLGDDLRVARLRDRG